MTMGLDHSFRVKEGQIQGHGTEPFPNHIQQNSPLLQIWAWLCGCGVTTLFFILAAPTARWVSSLLVKHSPLTTAIHFCKGQGRLAVPQAL